MNPAKLKVVELRAELSARGLDTKGNKAVLVERLQEALDQETGGDGDKQDEGSSEEQSNQGPPETTEQEHEGESESESQREPAQVPPPEAEHEPEPEPETVHEPEPEPVHEPEPEPEREPTPEPTPVEAAQEEKENVEKQEAPRSETPEPEQKEEQSPQKVPTPPASPPKAPTPQETPHESHEKGAEQMEVDESKPKSDKYDPDDTEDLDDAEEKQEDEKMETEPAVKKEQDSWHTKYLNQSENGHKEGFEGDVKPDIKDEAEFKMEPDDSNAKSEHYDSRDDHYDSSRDRKRRRSRSGSPRGRSERKSFTEWEPEIQEDAVTLSWYDSDLNLTIEDKNFLEATPFSDGGFGYVWAGVRGTHGFTSGAVCYQVKVNNYLDVSHLDDEPNPNLIRVGWSAFSASLQLGEEPFSYGYGGTGKFSVDSKFTDYGKPFGLDDIVTCYLQFTDEEAIISFGVNDEYHGVAQRVPLETLEGKALAPHILTKNSGFKVNFGQEEPWAEVQEGFEFVAKVPKENAVPGPRRPEKRSDCEMIMMCGLPACGKTVWANKHAAEHPEKNYNILGTNALIDRMKCTRPRLSKGKAVTFYHYFQEPKVESWQVMGLPRKANYSGRWDVLIEKCTKCLQRLMDIGCHRRRNYILDQTNVFPAAQRRKMRNFEGFTRKAVVIVPTDEEFQSRSEKQANEEKKDVPETAVLEMKANFTLPDKTMFDEVMYVELQEEEAQALIEKYAKEAAEKGHYRKSGGGGGPPNKRFRGGDYHQKNDYRRDRFSSGQQGSPYRRGSDRGGRGGGGGGWGGRGGSGDRWRDRQGGGYGRPQGDRSGWRGPPSGPPGGNGRGPRDYDRGRDFGRGGGYDRDSRSGPRQGGGYGNRDYPRDNRSGGMKSGGMGGKPRPGDKQGQGNAAPQAQWGNQYQGQQGQAAAAGGQQGWGQQQWGQQAQAWNNYQQQWKGYQQGYNQQGYSQGYTPQQYNNWQQYYGNYQQQGWGQNSDGTYNYPQSWQNWYAAQNASQASAAQQPPATK